MSADEAADDADEMMQLSHCLQQAEQLDFFYFLIHQMSHNERMKMHQRGCVSS